MISVNFYRGDLTLFRIEPIETELFWVRPIAGLFHDLELVCTPITPSDEVSTPAPYTVYRPYPTLVCIVMTAPRRRRHFVFAVGRRNRLLLRGFSG
jgi:hypothetical protein